MNPIYFIEAYTQMIRLFLIMFSIFSIVLSIIFFIMYVIFYDYFTHLTCFSFVFLYMLGFYFTGKYVYEVEHPERYRYYTHHL